ncbi:MAG: IS1380 family transposase [Actinomycetota bacterium]|nr:IS1380 family transposase [Actinomycetota bacterium]
MRLLSQGLGLTSGLSAGMRRRGFEPVYDRGQVLVDLALTLIDGGEAISDFRALGHLASVIGPVPSVPTVWRVLNEAGDLRLARVNAAVTEFRRHWRGLLSARPEGFPWLKVAGRELTGTTVLDLDASIVFARSDKKENAVATYKGGIGFCPDLAACDNTGDMLAIDPRPGNPASNCAADNIALPGLAVSRLPGPSRHNMLFRLDGAGFSRELLEHIAASGGKRGRHWEFSVGWSCTDTETDAIARIPRKAWTAGTGQDGAVAEGTRVAELTGLPDLGAWTEKIPGLRILVREEPLHPRYLKRATEREIKLGKRYQLIATSTRQGQLAWLDARHRSHVHVEGNVKQAKALGLNRWPSRRWAVNVAWTQVVLLAANILAAFRHLALPPGELRDAAPKLLRFRFLHVPGRLTRGQRKRWLHLRRDWPRAPDIIAAWNAVRTLPAPA